MTAEPQPDRSEQPLGRRNVNRVLGVDLLAQLPDATDDLCGQREPLSRVFEYVGHHPKDTSARFEEGLPIDTGVNVAQPVN
jgi:hypothetical protein